MILINLSVKHKAFGEGVVVATDGKYMTVKFAAGEKRFVYPDAFEKFLTLADGTLSDEILADLANAEEVKRRIEAAKNDENVRAMMHGIVIPGKENVLGEGEDEENHFKNNETEEV